MIAKKITIATHEMVYGVADALKDYLVGKKIDSLYYIGLPLVFNRKYSRFLYSKGKLVKKTEFTEKINLGVINYIFEFVFVFLNVFSKEKTDIFIGFDVLNCYAGLCLRMLGKTSKVILFTMDFTPRKFNNSLLNTLYHYIEKVCVRNADEVWDVSPRIEEGRKEFLGISSYKKKIVQVGIWEDQVKRRTFAEVKKYQLLFLGSIYEKQGIQLVLDVIPEIIKKIPDFKFVVMGGGKYEEVLKQKVKDLEMEKYVDFTGWVSDRKIIDEAVSESAVAIATYKPEKEKLYNFSYYGDPGKIKDYIGAGVPVIVTDVSYNAKEIDKRRCGILVGYNKKDIFNAIIYLMTNEEVFKEYRNNCLNYSKEFKWENIFDAVFKNL